MLDIDGILAFCRVRRRLLPVVAYVIQNRTRLRRGDQEVLRRGLQRHHVTGFRDPLLKAPPLLLRDPLQRMAQSSGQVALCLLRAFIAFSSDTTALVDQALPSSSPATIEDIPELAKQVLAKHPNLANRIDEIEVLIVGRILDGVVTQTDQADGRLSDADGSEDQNRDLNASDSTDNRAHPPMLMGWLDALDALEPTAEEVQHIGWFTERVLAIREQKLEALSDAQKRYRLQETLSTLKEHLEALATLVVHPPRHVYNAGGCIMESGFGDTTAPFDG